MPRTLQSALLTCCVIWLLEGAPLTASVDSCIAMRRPHWKADEVRVWAALCKGEKVDFHPVRGTVRGAFLREVLTAPLSAAWGRRLELSNIVVEGKTNWSGLEVNHVVRILDSTFQGEIDGSDTSFKGSVCLQGSDLLGAVNFGRSQINGGLYLGDERDPYRCGPEPYGLIINVQRRKIAQLNLDSLTAKDDIYVRNFITDRVISAEQVESQKNIFFWYCSVAGIRLGGARAGRQINIVDCSVRNAHENGYDFSVQLNNARSKEGIFLTRSKLFGPALLDHINCSFVNMRGTQLRSIDLSEALLSTNLDFGWVIDPGSKAAAHTRWEPYKNSWMNLHDAKLGSIVIALPRDGADITGIWPESIGALGMTYERFYGVSVDVGKLGSTAIPETLPTDTYLGFLTRQKPFSETGYRSLGNFLVNSGEEVKGRSVLYAGRVATRRENIRAAGWLDLAAYAGWFESFMLDVTIGYGYYMYRVVLWICGRGVGLSDELRGTEVLNALWSRVQPRHAFAGGWAPHTSFGDCTEWLAALLLLSPQDLRIYSRGICGRRLERNH